MPDHEGIEIVVVDEYLLGIDLEVRQAGLELVDLQLARDSLPGIDCFKAEHHLKLRFQ